MVNEIRKKPQCFTFLYSTLRLKFFFICALTDIHELIFNQCYFAPEFIQQKDRLHLLLVHGMVSQSEGSATLLTASTSLNKPTPLLLLLFILTGTHPEPHSHSVKWASTQTNGSCSNTLRHTYENPPATLWGTIRGKVKPGNKWCKSLREGRDGQRQR